MRPALPPAVVVGSDCVTGLQTARILAAHRIPVYGVAGNLRHFCCRTRVYVTIVQAEADGPSLVAALQKLATRFDQKAVLFPCTDLSVLAVSRERTRLQEAFEIALPAPEVVELLLDKTRFAVYARDHHLPIPRTQLLRHRDDVETAAAELRFPVMLKPAIKTAAWEREGRPKVYKLAAPADLRATYTEVAGSVDTLLAQEWVVGAEQDHFTCNGYFDREARPVVTFVTQKLRQWPPQTGQGSLAVESRNEIVLAETVRLFSEVGFWGLAYLEMKRDARSGEHYIIEPNVGRPTGRSAAAEAAGVDLLYAAYCDILRLPLPESRLRQRYAGAKWLYFGRDIRSAFYHWRRGELTVLNWLRSLRGRKVDAVFSWRDPLPFWFDVCRAPALIRRRGYR